MDDMNKSVKGDLGRTIAVWYDILARHKLEETCPPAL
jgi:hypothetical protein